MRTHRSADADVFDVVVCGAGMVGAALARGLLGQGHKVLTLDGDDADFRAAKANFGLVWVQGKGFGNPDYQRLSHLAARLWPAFAAELEAETDIALQFENRGGLNFCLGTDQFESRAARLAQWQSQVPEVEGGTEMLERTALARLLPGVVLGDAVTGASFGHSDGHVNPLRLLAALQKSIVARGGQLLHGQKVDAIEPLAGGGFRVRSGARTYEAPRVVIAAGLGSAALAAMVDLDVPVRAQRGQILVTERLAPFLPFPASGIRQTGEGSVMVGLTQEEVGLDISTTTEAAVKMSRQALGTLPQLAQANWVRQWSCLRIMTPDGCPVYAQSASFPGAFIALCHSGVTLASFHAGPMALALSAQALPADLNFFHHGRFDVSQTA